MLFDGRLRRWRGGSRPAAAGRSRCSRSSAASRAFRWLAIAFALSTLATTTVSVHLVALLLERGFALGFAGGAMGMLGLMALPGRLIFTPLGSRWARSTVTASIFGLQAVACAVLLASRQTAAVWLFVALFGAGFGAITPARAALIAELYGPAHYGRISGYDVVVAALLALSLGSASAVMAVRRGSSAFAAPATPVSGVP